MGHGQQIATRRLVDLTCQNMGAVSIPQIMLPVERVITASRGQQFVKIAAIFTAVIVIAASLRALPSDAIEIRNILHHLNFVPLILAGMLYGWRMALAATAFAFAAESLNFLRALQASAFDAVDLLAELAIFGVASVIAGILSDRSRRQRDRLEQAAAELARVYQELSQNIEQLKKTERLSAAGQLSASLAHEIRNPLASISGAAGLLKRSYFAGGGETNGTSGECLEIIEKESQRLNKLLTNFLEFARPRVPRFQQADIGEIVQSVIALAAHSTGQQIELRRNVQNGLLPIECDPEQIKQVLLNLVMNAIQASPGGGVVEISAFTESGHVAITVRDEGHGMAHEKNEHIFTHMFEPFFTTKEHGSGLGLAISAKIVEQHRGRLQGRNNLDRGMTFRVDLPLVQERTREPARVMAREAAQ
jgi:two-component system, NtrC family, sensor histidine kinase HydH